MIRLLRPLVGLLAVGVLGAVGVLYGISETTAAQFPEYAHLQIPIFTGVALGAVPVSGGLITVWQLVGVAAEPAAAFSERTVDLLRRLRLLILATAGYFALGLLGVWVFGGVMHPGYLLMWLALESVALFAFSLVALLERLFRSGIEYRTDSELTV